MFPKGIAAAAGERRYRRAMSVLRIEKLPEIKTAWKPSKSEQRYCHTMEQISGPTPSG